MEESQQRNLDVHDKSTERAAPDDLLSMREASQHSAGQLYKSRAKVIKVDDYVKGVMIEFLQSRAFVRRPLSSLYRAFMSECTVELILVPDNRFYQDPKLAITYRQFAYHLKKIASRSEPSIG